MNKFSHNFTLNEKTESCRIYHSQDNIARIDFISESAVRVAVYKNDSVLLPTFSVSPDNDLLLKGRDRLSTDGFCLCEPECTLNERGEDFLLPCGVKMSVDLHNFILSYSIGDKELFSDRKPLAYNINGEFGREKYHYITREKGERVYGLGDKGGKLNKSGRSFRIECCDAMGYDASESDPLYKHLPFHSVVCHFQLLYFLFLFILGVESQESPNFSSSSPSMFEDHIFPSQRGSSFSSPQ